MIHFALFASWREILRLAWVGLILLAPAILAQHQPGSQLTIESKEVFLLNAKIGRQLTISKGVTSSHQALLDDGKLKHLAHIQTVEISKPSYQTSRGTERNFRDSYKFNIRALRSRERWKINRRETPSVFGAHKYRDELWEKRAHPTS